MRSVLQRYLPAVATLHGGYGAASPESAENKKS
jgi:hypothetical protein